MKLVDFLTEDAHRDMTRDNVADGAVSAISMHFYQETKESDGLEALHQYGLRKAEINFADEELAGVYWILDPKVIGPYHRDDTGEKTVEALAHYTPDVVYLFGKLRGYAPTGMAFRLSDGNPILGYHKVVIIWCAKSNNLEELANTLAYNSNVHETIKHEIIHCLDRPRYKQFPRRNYDTSLINDPSVPVAVQKKHLRRYLNSSVEFNAYFHNMAGKLTSLVRTLQKTPIEDRADTAEIFDFKRNFAQMLGDFFGYTDGPHKDFVKNLTKRNRRGAIKRLYALHQYALKLLDDKNERITEAIAKYKYITSCVDCPDFGGEFAGNLINNMCDHPGCKEITYTEFERAVGTQQLTRVFSDYDWSRRPIRLTLERDYHVHYYKSKFCGIPCVYAVHSAVEYIFTLGGRRPTQNKVSEGDVVNRVFDE